jgi:hypothetical protein
LRDCRTQLSMYETLLAEKLTNAIQNVKILTN